FNGLILGAGLDCWEVVILRAYAKFLRQAQVQVSQETLEATLAAYPNIARLVVRLFQAQFDPALSANRDSRVAGIQVELDHVMDAVDNLGDDRNLRRFIGLVGATLRTNYYQKDAEGRRKSYLSMKLDSSQIDDLPLPRPWREIFVYSPRLEAVHLRGGRVARGGIRWSDRREDFRTEVLGLMKAQMVKNAVIVPVGSKGGFVLKRPPKPGDREALQAEGIACYQTMMRGLLDLTDNLVGGAVEPPPDVVRRDEDDPYLVVAADKGTATFSDIANGVSAEYGFWLGDAFASGGSAGYDHKKMGITARGAWESVKRNFRELGHNTQTQPFTVVGVGDMSGDVFGNGMLLSEQIRLQAAFNHLHIFIDPDPDPAVSFAERQRLFDLGRGSWDQYDTAKISDGGAVFDRRAKSIKLTPEMRATFGIERSVMTPNELISALLKAEVDLLWFGGIGTYVKGDDESHAEVGDKANDALRISGSQVRARVVGEGANLGLTQRGRIDTARAGSRLNTDFVDNSGGVDCSDHEVNIKILLNSVVGAGDMTVKQRNQVLEGMTEEVAGLVLRDNYLQTQALSLAMAEAGELLDQQARFMRALEKAGQLNRAIEFLPDDEELTERLGRREGLTRPEQAVVLSYGKMMLYDTLLAGGLPDDPALAQDLHLYFPARLQDNFEGAMGAHPLRREIIATSITNSMVNRVGPTFVAEMSDKTGMGASDVARAYLIVRDSFDLRGLWSRIEGLDTQVDAGVQTHMLLLSRRLVERATGWVLRYCTDNLNVGQQVAHLKPGVDLLIADLDSILYDDAREVLDKRVRNLTKAKVPDDLAYRVSALNILAAGFDLIRISDTCGIGLAEVAPVYFDIGRRLGLAFLRDSAGRMPTANHWQKQAVAAIIDDLYALQSDLTQRVVQSAEEGTPWDEVAEAWLQKRAQPVERIDQLIAELRALDHVDVSMLAVANRRLRGLMAG
ncbi:MAG: NAD-glutamate dehydrogenase, partial [Rhodospirillaceae bacterium]|nr:NAD-glutamate dehydrogenase [Rhodospirillaceae bacterium]